ncbi:hypothetical protein CBR_g46021 [Chara braunii]|uniref:EGF-like domain-containing protein n=1 Tax=Chara braunii TaxID=69332 RepID=A0A388M018_CHABU|nr:hypothetical protein CBR_g46021 [Chara braunii]|eukprot:GBG87865.1 hypothetical protein CBR_g46021 [Chara braunii]
MEYGGRRFFQFQPSLFLSSSFFSFFLISWAISVEPNSASSTATPAGPGGVAAVPSVQSPRTCECLNGGQCTDGPLGAGRAPPVCTCPEANATNPHYFRGTLCQTPAVRCNDTWWCENGGICDRIADGFKCNCTGSFQGVKCATPVQMCDENVWCANGGQCGTSESNRTICKCPSTHTGANCEREIEDQDLEALLNVTATTNSTLPVQPLPTEGNSIQDKAKYVRVFFLMLGALLLIWAVSFGIVQYRRRLKNPPQQWIFSKSFQPGAVEDEKSHRSNSLLGKDLYSSSILGSHFDFDLGGTDDIELTVGGRGARSPFHGSKDKGPFEDSRDPFRWEGNG